MPAAPLSEAEVRRALSGLAGWSGSPAGLERTWRFASFPAAIGFMHEAAAGIERRNHHPEWTNVYDRVRVLLRTHDAGDRVTAADVDLAMFLDEQAREHGGA